MIDIILALVLSSQALPNGTLNELPDRVWIHTCMIPNAPAGLVAASNHELVIEEDRIIIRDGLLPNSMESEEIVLNGDEWHCISIRLREDRSDSGF